MVNFLLEETSSPPISQKKSLSSSYGVPHSRKSAKSWRWSYVPPASHKPASGKPGRYGRETSRVYLDVVCRGSLCAGMEHLSPPTSDPTRTWRALASLLASAVPEDIPQTQRWEMPSTSPAPPGNHLQNCGDKPYDSEGPRHPSELWDTWYWPAECRHPLGHAGPAANASNRKTPSRPSQALWERPLDGPAGRWTWQRECQCQSPLQLPHVLPRCGVWSTTPRRPPGAHSRPSPSQRWDEHQMPEGRNLPPPAYQVVVPRDWSRSCRPRSREASSLVGLCSHQTLNEGIPT